MSNTIKDIANICHVSIATVSRAFKEGSVIKPETREYILKVASEMGYSPNFMASALKSSRTHVIGFLVPSITNSFYIDLLAELEPVFHAHGYRILVTFQQEGISEREAFQAMMVSRPEGIITFPTGEDNSALFRRISENTEIVQLFARRYPEYSFIDSDDYAGTLAAAEYLIEQGHSKILFTHHEFDFLRRDAFCDAMWKHGLAVTDNNILSFPGIVDSAQATAQAAEKIETLGATAILSIATTSEYTWKAIYHLKLHVPDDISFIAYDDVSWVRLMEVTAVSHPFRVIAETVANHLIPRIEARVKGEPIPEPAVYVTKPFLTCRSSVRSISIETPQD